MKRPFLPLLVVLTLTACSLPVDAPPPPTSIFTATPQPAMPASTVVPATFAPPIITSTPAVAGFCQDPRTLQLLNDLQIAVKNRDGVLLASLVSPGSGLGVRFIRNGNVVTYFDNIKFVFETTYEADWGLGAGSGEPVKGSFQDVALPSLDTVFASTPIITCNELKTGGATYIPEWPYSGMDYYSVHFPGTDEFGGLNWETWVVGMVRQEGKPMLAALVHFAWEP